MALERTDNSSIFFAGGIQLLQRQDTTIILPAVLTAISGIGVPGNLILLVVLVYGLRTGTVSEARTLLASLCVTDLLILSVCVPVRVITYHTGTWMLGDLACKTTEWFQHGCLAAKNFTLAATSIARDHPPLCQVQGAKYRARRALWTMVFSWIVALVFPIPELMFSKMQARGDSCLCVCEIPRKYLGFISLFSKVFSVAACAIPILIAFISYTRTIFHTKSQTANVASSPAQHQARRRALMLLSLTVAHTLLVLPQWVFWAWARHNPRVNFQPPATLLIIAQVCVYLSSTWSPAILLTAHGSLREDLSRVCRSVSCQDSKSESDEPQELGGNEQGTRMILINLPADSRCASLPPELQSVRTDEFGRLLPDLQQFWTGRQSTLVLQEHDPLPWERFGESTANL
ncbi:G-protein coupled receptor 151 [Alosa sapidissima]|uniref:G-protein coupled receptor 151 n=1 Tax=Alosa sapidissima TaxID=34773 RepID=UPI001C08E8CE|nr:G-protein coupled receptor 151 [Alosa sapidissima]